MASMSITQWRSADIALPYVHALKTGGNTLPYKGVTEMTK